MFKNIFKKKKVLQYTCEYGIEDNFSDQYYYDFNYDNKPYSFIYEFKSNTSEIIPRIFNFLPIERSLLRMYTGLVTLQESNNDMDIIRYNTLSQIYRKIFINGILGKFTKKPIISGRDILNMTVYNNMFNDDMFNLKNYITKDFIC